MITPTAPPEKILVIIPAFNEEEVLPSVLQELESVFPEASVLVVDDGSEDATCEVARKHGAMVARLPFNLGIGGAIRTGFRWAVRDGYSRAVQLDADGQHEPREIPKLLEALDQGANLVVGSRFIQTTAPYEVGRVRKGAMSFLRMILWLASGRRLTDTSSGFRAFDRTAMEFFDRNYPVEYLDSVESMLLALYAGLRVVEVPVTMRERKGGVPSTRNWKLLYHYLRVLIVAGASLSLRARAERRASLER